LKKTEAKKFQALADAFKQHDIERELIVQKKVEMIVSLTIHDKFLMFLFQISAQRIH